jgi:hypothetical protein
MRTGACHCQLVIQINTYSLGSVFNVHLVFIRQWKFKHTQGFPSVNLTTESMMHRGL